MLTNPALMVRKRNDSIVEFDISRIQNGIQKAAQEAGADINGQFDSLMTSIIDESINESNDRIIPTELLQSIVKRQLMNYKYHRIAEEYIIYSDKQNKRRVEPNPGLMSDYVTIARYARYNKEWKRRELYHESVTRVEKMHVSRYPEIEEELRWAFKRVYDKKALPSMRSMHYGGPAQEFNHAKGYNCSYSVCNRAKFFSEAFWLLLSGTGIGFSVQYQHVDMIDTLKFIDKQNVKHFEILDTIEGWADAAHELIKSYTTTGHYVEFSYHKIRPFGAALKTSGGKAPGHIPLKTSLENVRVVLNNAQGRQLKPIECYDITCMLADAVYSGGIREAATICLFSLDDGEMMNAKTGNWFENSPWRARSNNSVVLNRKDCNKRQYDRIFKATKQWGEPGFFFTDDEDMGANPCVEIGLNPKLEITPEIKISIEAWASKTNRKLPKLKVNQVHWGWQMCNLTEANAATAASADDLYERVRAAAIIGTAQAGYTDFPYLGWVSEAICNRESLIGVSMTGIMDNPAISLDPEIQRTAAQIVVETNIEIAAKIGINSAARTTCVKPSGTASLVLGVSAGIHPHHAARYFRRIRANPICPVYREFKKHNPHMCTAVNQYKEFITFPVKAPDNALTRKDLTAEGFLNKVLSTMKNWVIPGTAKPNSSPGVNHNVSNTITVRSDEWDDVREFLWKHRRHFNGVSLLADIGDKTYADAPNEEVKTESDEAKWLFLVNDFKPIDWAEFKEEEDSTQLAGEKACAGGACSL